MSDMAAHSGSAARRKPGAGRRLDSSPILNSLALFAMSLAGASEHIKALESAGLIRREVRGRTHLCRLDPGPLAGAHHWLSFYERFWTDRLDALERLLREEDARPSPPPPKGDDK